MAVEGEDSVYFSLNRRALAPLACLRAYRRAGAVAPAGPLCGPVPLTATSRSSR